MSNSLTK